MCRGHNVSVLCQLQVGPVRTMGEKREGVNLPVGNSGVTIPCCLWSADVLTI
jgi:hypothetical protein